MAATQFKIEIQPMRTNSTSANLTTTTSLTTTSTTAIKMNNHTNVAIADSLSLAPPLLRNAPNSHRSYLAKYAPDRKFRYLTMKPMFLTLPELPTPPKLLLEDTVNDNFSYIPRNPTDPRFADAPPEKSIFVKTTSELCGFPGTCQGSTADIYRKCFNTTLLQCQECGVGRGAFFLFIIIVLGLAILIGNILTICVWYKRFHEKKETKLDIYKCSLAVADFMTGIQILAVTVYNFNWSMNLTPLELDAQQLLLRGSPQAIAGGILSTFGFTSSLYHLIYMGIERLYCIAMPVRYRNQSKRSACVGLGIVWILAISTATIPVWFSSGLVFTYLASGFIFTVSPEEFNIQEDYVAIVTVIVILYLVPYVLMTISTVGTSLIIFRHSKRRKLISANPTAIKQQAHAAHVTVTIMQLGFTVTLAPILAVIGLIYTGNLDCSNLSLPYLIGFYLRMANSLVNVIIYNVRDRGFRKDIAEIFKWTLPR